MEGRPQKESACLGPREPPCLGASLGIDVTFMPARAPLANDPGKGVPAVTLDQKRARIFGVLYLITFITSIPAALLYQPVLDHPVAYITGAGDDNQIFF